MASSSSSSANTQTAFLNANLPSKKPCSICGAVVSTSNMARHKKSVKCVTTNVKPESNTNVVQSSSNNSVVVQRASPAKPRKASCSNCGAFVNASNLARHQKSKKCVTKNAVPFQTESSNNNGQQAVNAEERLCNPLSPAYQSPLHFPESPSYSPLSPTDQSTIRQTDESTADPFMAFHDDLFTPPRAKRREHYSITQTKSRFVKKYNT